MDLCTQTVNISVLFWRKVGKWVWTTAENMNTYCVLLMRKGKASQEEKKKQKDKV